MLEFIQSNWLAIHYISFTAGFIGMLLIMAFCKGAAVVNDWSDDIESEDFVVCPVCKEHKPGLKQDQACKQCKDHQKIIDCQTYLDINCHNEECGKPFRSRYGASLCRDCRGIMKTEQPKETA